MSAVFQNISGPASSANYAAPNSAIRSVLNLNYGASWLQPSLLQDARMVQFSGTLNF